MLPKYKSGAARKRIAYLLGALLIINATVAHIVTNQLVAASGGENQVKEDQVVVEEAAEITDEEAIGSDEGEETPKITIYTVKSGDTLSTIADKFGISSNTIRWANEIGKNDTIRTGQTLVILSIDGIQYKVKTGDG
jgi:LysM repeat protein